MPLPAYDYKRPSAVKVWAGAAEADSLLLRYYAATRSTDRSRKPVRPIGQAQVYRVTDAVIVFCWDEYEEVDSE